MKSLATTIVLIGSHLRIIKGSCVARPTRRMFLKTILGDCILRRETLYIAY